MDIIDPTKFHVEASHPAHYDQEHSFQEIMAEQLRHAPWLMLSLVIHVAAAMVLLMMPVDGSNADDKALQMKIPEPEEEIEEPEEVVEETEEEETEEEPVLQDMEVEETEDVAETFDDFDSETDSNFDNDAWNTALGLGGGGGGKFSGRRGGRKALAKSGRQTAQAIELGLEWLKAHQDDDGMWDTDEFMKHDQDGEPCDGEGHSLHDIGITGLALLAFLGDGSTMNSGPYKDVIKRGVRWLREQQDPDTGLFGTANSNEFIYNHTIATLAMIETYGLSDSRLLRKYAQRGINYMESHRNPYSVWRYQPQDGDNDTSITGWAVMAYKSAQDFKLDVNQTALDNAQAWFDSMTDPRTARTGYITMGSGSSRREGIHAEEFPRERGECMTAVALLCRFFLGQDPNEAKIMKQQADLISTRLPKWDEKDGSIDHYYWYYASYALYQMGGKHWKTWSAALTKAVANTQRKDGNYRGSWDPAGAWGEDGGRVYSTAILVLTLEAYYRYSALVR
ncbi:MAG: prenyltransferase/squalene oxidase repeat-containing protein [Planctomycetota bacterium]|jgi:hypothetical protein